MRLLITRPEPQASSWVSSLHQQGVDAAALPLIAIDGPADPQPVRALWQHLNEARLLMFVSPSAADWFFRLKPANQGAQQHTWPPSTLAAAPGPGTAQALLKFGQAAGLRVDHILSPGADADQYDSETLWPLLQPLDWQNQTVWIISGGDRQDARGRTWLSEQLRARGAQVTSLLTYQRAPAHWTPTQQTTAQTAIAQPAQHAWLFSSSEAIDHLTGHLTPDQAWNQSTALATHPRIAERAQQAGFGRIIATRPTIEAVANALRSLQSTARIDTMNS
ncbi:MAG: uroporphyrinogen-III synthase [Burkholderiales bacterium]|nr:uroporphyrinogen-III synthase [Burkholderiales bacterium]